MSHAALAAVTRPDNVPPELVVDWNVYDPPRAREIGPHLAYKALQGGPDIVWTPRNGGHWLLTRGEDIDFVQRNHDPFSMQDVGVPHGTKPMRLLPLEADPPEHSGYRAIINPWFSPKSINLLKGFTNELAAKLVAELAPRGRCEFYKDFAQHLPIAIFCKLTNVPWTDREMLLEWTEWTTRSQDPELRVRAHHNMIGYIKGLIADRRAHPGDDVLTDIVMAKIQGEPLAEEDIISMMLVILFGGLDTVASSMSFIMHFLATHPGHVRQLVSKPDLIPHAIEEMVRRFGVSSTARTVTRDYDYKGLHFRKGDKVFVVPLLYGLDERKFDDPLEVDFGRKNTIHAGFGAGPHRCPGSLLARLEIRALLEAWLPKIPQFEVTPGEEVTFLPGIVNCIGRLPLSWRQAA
jgi:cytochrome P450